MTAIEQAIPVEDPARLLQPGRNCWRVEHARRFSLLVDADAYFRAVRQAIRSARHSVFILSWDIDSRVRLVPGGAGDGYPEALGDFLHAIVSERNDLHVYVLNWDFAVLYTLEREWLQQYKLGWRTHHRLHFQMDAHHPVSASHHQKVVVVDDAIAFVGGLDLTRCRWDTSEHAPEAPLRCDEDGKSHSPFHDVQSLVDGDAARALGELARTRWLRAIGEPAKPMRTVVHDPWPSGVQPDLTDIDIAIARTEPEMEGRAGVHEVRQLYQDAIRAAKRYLFCENQYFTSSQIAATLAQRLKEPGGPEIVVVSPKQQSGWLEEATMGVLRERIHRQLKASDRENRYRLYCPHLPGLDNGCLNVHSKVFVVDDELFCVGSANMSNRSMAFDTECNIAIEAAGTAQERLRIRKAIAGLRNRLLGEHLDVAPETLAAAIAKHGSLIEAIDSLKSSERSLRDLDPSVAPELDHLISDLALIDPERPMKPEELAAYLVPPEARKPLPRRMIVLGVVAVTLALLAVAWRWSPLREMANLPALIALAHHVSTLPLSPLLVMVCYVAAALVVLPVTLLIAVTAIVFGPVYGTLYAIAGSLLSASVCYGIGHWLGHDTVRRLVNAPVRRLSKRIARRGVLAVVLVRIVPVAPFALVNIGAGASGLRFRDYLLGTSIGMLPGILLTVTFVHHLVAAVRDPNLVTTAILAVIAATLLGVAFGLKHLLARGKDTGRR